MVDIPDSGTPARRSLVLPALAALLLLIVFVGLGTWQLQRRQWKHALIARVDQRVHAAPVPAPAPPQWPAVSAQSDEYRHVVVAGTFLNERTVPVQAVTELGAGFWLLTPLRSTQGWLVLVNRGFVPTRPAASPASGSTSQIPVSVSGLLRMSEPGGAFLRKNDPAAGRWYSRDVAAIAATQGLNDVAPYFIDADAASAEASGSDSGPASAPANAATAASDAAAGPPGRLATGPAPVGGLTVIAFPDNHMVYALTWYALALMVAGMTLRLVAAGARRANPTQPARTRGDNQDDTQNGTDRDPKDGRSD